MQFLSLQLHYAKTPRVPHKLEWLSILLQSSVAAPLRLDPTMQATLFRAEYRGFYKTDKQYITELQTLPKRVFDFLSSL